MSRQATPFDIPAESYAPAHRKRTKASRDDYEGFVDKFKPRLTTDDCYTPEPVIDAVTAFARTLPLWAVGGTPVRPFWPGADYAARDYAPGEVVVDNPPFSILADIIKKFSGRGVPFFLFAPHLTCFNYLRYPGITVMPMCSNIVYTNGAIVNTAFVTNLYGSDVAVVCDSRLHDTLEMAIKATRPPVKNYPKYQFPPELLTAAKLGVHVAKRGGDITILRQEMQWTAALDAQRKVSKSIFGTGIIVSRDVAKRFQRAAEERADHIIIWELSPRERAVIDALDANGHKDFNTPPKNAI